MKISIPAQTSMLAAIICKVAVGKCMVTVVKNKVTVAFYRKLLIIKILFRNSTDTTVTSFFTAVTTLFPTVTCVSVHAQYIRTCETHCSSRAGNSVRLHGHVGSDVGPLSSVARRQYVRT